VSTAMKGHLSFWRACTRSRKRVTGGAAMFPGRSVRGPSPWVPKYPEPCRAWNRGTRWERLR
jgi:hypothetical protein